MAQIVKMKSKSIDTSKRVISQDNENDMPDALEHDGASEREDVIVFEANDDLPEEYSQDEDVSVDSSDDFSEADYASNLPVQIGLARPAAAPTVSVDALHAYLREVSRFSMLAPDEEYELARRVQIHNDNEAAFRLISSHLRLVVKIAMDFQRRWMQNVLDLIQEGNVGLMRAVHKFDPDKGIKFSYYAAFWIKAYILKFIMDNWRMVKIGTTQTQRKLFYNLNKERQKLMAQGFDADTATLSKNLGVEPNQIIEMQQRLDGTDVSLDTPLSDDAGGTSRISLLPALSPGIEESMAVNEIAQIVQSRITDILPQLSDKEIYILENRLLTDDPVTLRDIGERYSITRERVRQLEVRLLQKLRAYLSKHIKDFSEDWIRQ
jgi:RNA polymerase sigma-32 factor